jgi:hypothetical protein
VDGEHASASGTGAVVDDGEEREARYAALASQPIRRARPTCALCNKPVEEFYEAHDPFLARVVFVARCHGESQRIALDEQEIDESRGKLDLGLAFVPEGPPALPAPSLRALPPAKVVSERCGEEYEYPSAFGMGLPYRTRCERRKGHEGGPPPRFGHSGAEKT